MFHAIYFSKKNLNKEKTNLLIHNQWSDSNMIGFGDSCLLKINGVLLLLRQVEAERATIVLFSRLMTRLSSD